MRYYWSNTMYSNVPNLAMLSSDRPMYGCRRLHAKVSVMTMEDPNGNIMDDNIATTQELKAIIRAIEQNDLDSLASCLNETAGKDISNRMVSVTLPRKWHKVAKTVMSSPLRVAITWRNAKALNMILASKCVVRQEDITLGLYKILRRLTTDMELQIIRDLISHSHSICVESPVHFSLAFERLFVEGDLDKSGHVVRTICRTNPSNHILGQLLLSVSKRTSRNYKPGDENNLNDLWTSFSADSIRCILESGFNPSKYLSDTKNWLAFSTVSFQQLAHALPVMVQTMTKCPIEAYSWVLRHVSRYFPLSDARGRAKIAKQLPKLMWASGMNVPQILKIACLSPRFIETTGLNRMNALKIRSLQDQCKFVIRSHITVGNVYCAMERITCIPKPIKDFILLKEVQALPWDIES